MASAYDTKTYCRQSLIGGNYGLLNTTTFVPNPDYYRYSNTGVLMLAGGLKKLDIRIESKSAVNSLFIIIMIF